MYRTFTQADPLPGHCDQAIQFDGIPTVFECQDDIGHCEYSACHFSEGGGRPPCFSIDWWPDEGEEATDG